MTIYRKGMCRGIGTTPIRYLREYRIGQAADRLANSQVSIADIAAECGVQDISYFTGTFREMKGVTPKQGSPFVSHAVHLSWHLQPGQGRKFAVMCKYIPYRGLLRLSGDNMIIFVVMIIY